MKIFILGYESTRKTGKNSVDHFLVSYLVPEMSRLEEPKHDPQNWLSANNSNSRNCDFIRFAC